MSISHTNHTIHEYCWKPDWISPCESLWSLLQKFAMLNHVSASEIRKHFQKSVILKRKNGRSDKKNSLLDSCVDITKLAKALMVSEEALLQGTVAPFLKTGEIDIFASDRLRFCPKCICERFHSVFHQLLFFSKCPYHNEYLLNECPKCHNSTPYYSLTNGIFSVPMSCTTCDYQFSSYLQKENVPVRNT